MYITLGIFFLVLTCTNHSTGVSMGKLWCTICSDTCQSWPALRFSYAKPLVRKILQSPGWFYTLQHFCIRFTDMHIPLMQSVNGSVFPTSWICRFTVSYYYAAKEVFAIVMCDSCFIVMVESVWLSPIRRRQPDSLKLKIERSTTIVATGIYLHYSMYI